MQEDERCTGALMLVWSGTVGYDPLVFIERHVGQVSFDDAQRNRNRSCHVTCLKSPQIAHIYDDRRAAFKSRLSFFEGDARHLRVCEGQLSFF